MPEECRKFVPATAVLLFSLVVKLTLAQAPDTLWTRTYGGTEHDHGYSVRQTLDGGFIVGGNIGWWGLLIKTNALGDITWIDTLSFALSTVFEVQQTIEGGYISVGCVAMGELCAILTKTDSMGNTSWTQHFGTGHFEAVYGRSVKQTTDMGYILVGDGFSIYYPDSWAYLQKVDSLGLEQWSLFFHNCGTGAEVQLASDGGYVAAMCMDGGGAHFVKCSSTGSINWQKTYGIIENAYALSICSTEDQGYVALAFVPGQDLLWLLRMDSVGDTLWTQTYWTGSLSYPAKASVRRTYNEGFIIGATRYGMYLLKTDSLGGFQWTISHGGGSDYVGSVEVTSDGGYIAVGSTSAFGAGGYDIYLLRLAPDTLGIGEEDVGKLVYRIFPSTIISGSVELPESNKCRLFDITGRVVEPDKIQPGIYFIEVDDKIVRKVVKVR